jgi:hypothetical protein
MVAVTMVAVTMVAVTMVVVTMVEVEVSQERENGREKKKDTMARVENVVEEASYSETREHFQENREKRRRRGRLHTVGWTRENSQENLKKIIGGKELLKGHVHQYFPKERCCYFPPVNYTFTKDTHFARK